MTATATRTFSIPRPSEAEFRRLHNSRHGEIAQALDMDDEDFTVFKVRLFSCAIFLLNLVSGIQRQVREKMYASLDPSKKFDEQDPSAWRRFVQWVGQSVYYCSAFVILASTFKAYETMPSLISKYEDAWPVELYVKISLSKRIAHERFRFRKAVAKYKQTMTMRSSSSAVRRLFAFPSVHAHYVQQGEAEMSPTDLPPPYDEIDRVTDSETPGVHMHPDAVPENIEKFLRSCDFDLGHLTSTFVTRRAGLFNLGRLELLASWPAALRRDHLERHFGTMLDDVEIEVLNKRFVEMSHVQI